MFFRRLALALPLLLAGLSPAFAVCPGPSVLFQDSFDTLQPTWGEPSDAIKVANGQLVMTPPVGTYIWAVNNAGVYDDLDMCVTVTTVTGVDPTEAKAGPIFWYTDVNNFYVFEIAPNGKASVWRRQRGKWLAQANWQDATDANKGDGASNELRVTTVGDDATFYVNGTQFKKVSGSAPDDGQQIGLFAASPDKDAATFAFDDLKATKP
ncbi:MAG TPA: hypothetical protein VG894_00455 [Bauldia sp.]|nr:hypothetical protein [Bauldia sp.]